MKVAALFSVGISDGGCPAAIGEILKLEESLDVHVLYGKRGAPDAADPKETAARIREGVCDQRVRWTSSQPVEPFDLSKAYDEVRAFVAGIAAQNYDRVYVAITGGTNPMVTSLFQTAMAYLSCEVLPIYVQARGTVSVQHFLASGVRDRVVAEDALATARSGQVRVAARLAERLQSEDDWKFLRSSLKALAQWDDFDYDQAKQPLEHQARKATARLSHPLLASVADTVTRLAGDAGKMLALAKDICNEQNFGDTAIESDWHARVSEVGPSLVADAFANARRRITEGRYTDAVLRAYRAAECATQMRLLAIGIHPSRPDACQAAYGGYPQLAALNGGGIAFKVGLKFLESAGQIDFSRIEDQVMKLGSARNHTYLEHGYVRIQQDQAQRCLELSRFICSYLLGHDISQLSQRFEMRF
jgi:hypothetical protein